MSVFRSSPQVTARRFAELESYMAARVLTPDRRFVCERESDCRRSALYTLSGRPRAGEREFWRGQLSHVGDHYDLTCDGAPLRVVFVALETGRPDEGVTLRARTLDQDRAIFEQRFRTRKPHMRGTTSALRVLFGKGLGRDYDDEWVDVGQSDLQHVMDCYALLNVRLCSAVRAGTTDSCGTPQMSTNCLPHLAASIKILEPTIVVLQGIPIREAVSSVLTDVRSVGGGLPVEMVRFAGIPTVLVSLSHPSQKGTNAHLRWGLTAADPYLVDVVEPSLLAARRHSPGR